MLSRLFRNLHTKRAEPSVEASVLAAHRLLAIGDLARASATLDAVLALEPTQPDALLVLGMLREKQGDTRAREAYERAVAMHPEFSAAWAALGAWHTAHGETGDAIFSYREAIKHDNDQPSVH